LKIFYFGFIIFSGVGGYGRVGGVSIFNCACCVQISVFKNSALLKMMGEERWRLFGLTARAIGGSDFGN